jgi:hypothetical protein
LEKKMHNLKSPSIAALAAMLIANPTFAGELDGEVVSVLPSVSWSLGDSQPAASYTVTLTNSSNSGALNVARLVGTTSVVGASGVKAVFRGSDGATCTTTNVDKTSIDCNAGGLTVGQSKTFTVTFTAPSAGTKIEFVWAAVFDNGTPPGNSNGDNGTSDILLDPISNNKVVSDVPANLAMTFFTGTGVATSLDNWVTKVNVPSTSLASTGTIEEVVSAVTCAPDLLTCSTSQLTIPSSTFGIAGTRPLSQFLEVTLLRDASTIAKGAKIDSAVIYYKKLDTDTFEPVLACTDTTYGALPKLGRPCEDRTQRYAYPKKSSPKAQVPAGFEGDWKFVIYAVDNGKYNQ